MLRAALSFRGLILVLGLVAIVVPAGLIATLGLVRTLNTVNADVTRIREAQLAAAEVLQLQVDEETGIRGYAATRLPGFLEPYEHAREKMPQRLSELDAGLGEHGTGKEGDRAVHDLRAVNDRWAAEVAEPVRHGAPLDDRRAIEGKVQIDRFRGDVRTVQQDLGRQYDSATASRSRTIAATSAIAILAIGIMGVAIVVFGLVIARMRVELDRERAVVETLQQAASLRIVPPPHLAIGTAYRSATRGARIGGDVYDVYRLDADRTLIVIGDVSGKGLTAAVETMFVRFAIRTLANESLAPAEVLDRFEVMYADANPAPEAFVTLFVGIHDRRSATLRYANAGHEACWVRRPPDHRLETLAPTGPVVGLGGSRFAEAQTPLGPGDRLVLATDGLTEARNPQGGFVPFEDVSAWIAGAEGRSVQEYVDEIVARVSRFTNRRIRDDLAILAVAPLA